MDSFNPFEKNIFDLEPLDLLRLRDVHEGWYIDYKASPIKPRQYAKAIAAMANTYGGWVFIGIEEESKDNNVAGGFVGVPPNEVDRVCQHIRQSVAEHLNPTPHFDIKAVKVAETDELNQVICIQIPASTNAPVIHSDGCIYRRVNDSSEPKAENSREVVEHLIKRSNAQEQFYRDWFEDDPELSVDEGHFSYIRIIATPDYWNDHRLFFDGDMDKFAELLNEQSDGISFSIPYDNIQSQYNGFICRHEGEGRIFAMRPSMFMWRDLRSEFWLPLPSFNLGSYDSYHSQNSELSRLVDYLIERGYEDSTIIDLSSTFGALDSYFVLLRKFQKYLKYFGKTHVKFKVINVFKKIPVLPLSIEELAWDRYGVSIVLSNTVSSFLGGHLNSFESISLHHKPDEETGYFLIGSPVYQSILTALGLRVGSDSEFAQMAGAAAVKSYQIAFNAR